VPAFSVTGGDEPASPCESLQLTHRTAFPLGMRVRRRARLDMPHRLAHRDKTGQARTSWIILVQASASSGFMAQVHPTPQRMKGKSPTPRIAASQPVAALRKRAKPKRLVSFLQ